VVIGIPNCILLLNKYHTEYMLHQNKVQALGIAVKQIGITTFYANVTTAIGFGVFAFTKSEVLTQFGIVAAINVMATWIMSMVLIPVIFSFLPNPKLWQTKHLDNQVLKTFIQKIDHWIHFDRKKIYWTTLIIILISLVGISKINVNGYMVDDLPKNDPILADLRFFEQNFDGVLPLEIKIDTKRKNG
jgi:predicted RND superfamily exporter protein